MRRRDQISRGHGRNRKLPIQQGKVKKYADISSRADAGVVASGPEPSQFLTAGQLAIGDG